jgi:hypothetical protein
VRTTRVIFVSAEKDPRKRGEKDIRGNQDDSRKFHDRLPVVYGKYSKGGVVGGTLVCDRCWYGRGVAEAKKKAPGGTFISVKGSIKLGAL